MNGKFVTVDTIFAKIEREYTDGFSERDVIEWTGEALGFIGAVTGYQEAVCFVEVKNYQCFIPARLHQIVGIARDSRFSPKCGVTPKQVQDSILTTPNLEFRNDEKDYGYVVLDQNGMPLVEYDVAFYRPYFDLVGDYYGGWRNSSLCKERFTKVHLATHDYFSSIVLEDDCYDTNGLNPTCRDEYKIIENDIIRFSFRDGQVAIAYRRQLTDKKNRPMIPDHVSYIEAAAAYCMYKMVRKDWLNNREGAYQKKIDLGRDWDWYCGQAGNAAMMPDGEDAWQNYTDNNVHLLVPDRSRGYFGSKCGNPSFESQAAVDISAPTITNTTEIKTVVQGGSVWGSIEW